MSCLFVGNLTKSVSEPKLINIFSAIGKCKVELKGPYAFIEYDNPDDAKEALKKFNKTNLNGVNNYAKARIEFSKKKRVNDKLEDNDEIDNSDLINISESSSQSNIQDDEDNYIYDNKTRDRNKEDEKERGRYRSREDERSTKNRDRGKNDQDKEKTRKYPLFKDIEPPRRNVCFICKLPGHFAKECVLTRDSCYECGEKGHIAKECQAGVREAKILTKNRVKAIFSQQSAYKYVTPQSKLSNIIIFLKSKDVI